MFFPCKKAGIVQRYLCKEGVSPNVDGVELFCQSVPTLIP